jgi:hypothetical protein
MSFKSNSQRRYTLQPPIIQNSNEQVKRSNYSESERSSIDDPWVKQLLEREIDFSKYDQEEEVQLLNIQNLKHFSYENNFEPRRKTRLDNRNQYSQNNRKWILQQPTNSINNSRLFISPKIEQPLIEQRKKLISDEQTEDQNQ